MMYAAKALHRPGAPTTIEIHGAREHNLKNVDVNLELNQFTVITGVSGSGKSTLAFDILFAEGQRRYLESLNAYARPVRAALVASGRRRHLRHPAHRGDRATHQPRRAQEHGGHSHRDLSLLTAALRQAGCAVLPRLRREDRTSIRRRHRCAPAEGLSRKKHFPVGAAHRCAQGPVHGAGKVGARQGVLPPFRSTARCCPRRSGRDSIASSSTTSNFPWPH